MKVLVLLLSLGVGKADRRVIFLLDIGKVLTTEEAKELTTAS